MTVAFLLALSIVPYFMKYNIGDESHKQPCLFSDPVELILYMYIMLLFSCY